MPALHGVSSIPTFKACTVPWACFCTPHHCIRNMNSLIHAELLLVILIFVKTLLYSMDISKTQFRLSEKLQLEQIQASRKKDSKQVMPSWLKVNATSPSPEALQRQYKAWGFLLYTACNTILAGLESCTLPAFLHSPSEQPRRVWSHIPSRAHCHRLHQDLYRHVHSQPQSCHAAFGH